ncbi:DUF7529 family protein [Halopelagius longus]|uniref:Uncharacterized protein n=1 Tax=Halopelagius longus TaxID=1236180 RepID=A0A1H0XPQ1_9EURY|nr:hypothetical protein [Halopelagius longus]RDI72003.1 hypothetical protein DWB78_09875 [Halopelagius longus]SDQ04902.1 hypothetical protein SAMN05216278_0080 [Halopelagius longus]
MDDPNSEEGAHPLSGVMQFWDDVVGDAEATAEEYREAGWDVVELHPGDVTPVPAMLDTEPSAEYGLNVLVPGEEFDTVEDVVETAEFDSYDAYRAERGGTVFLVVAMLAEDSGRAVVVPMYYRTKEAAPMLERAADADEMRVIVRPLSDDKRVVFEQRDPNPLFPEGGA